MVSSPSSSPASHCMVYVTAASRDEALAIGRALVGERLAACANILDGMHAIYRWRDGVEEAREAVLILKTRRALAEKAIARVKALHSYDVPCAVAYDMSAGWPPYLAWMDGTTDLPET